MAFRARRIGRRRMRRPLRRPRISRKTYRYTGKKSYKKVVTVKRTVLVGAITQSAVNQNLAYQFRLSNLPNYTELTNLYDQYKIKSINFSIVPQVTSADANPNATAALCPSVTSVLDFSDSTALANLNDYLQYSTYKRTAPLKTHKRFFYPKQLVYAYDAVTATQNLADVQNKWIRSESPDIQHLGIKVYIPAAVNATFNYEVYATYYVLLKQSK